jgi:hypothetical protein
VKPKSAAMAVLLVTVVLPIRFCGLGYGGDTPFLVTDKPPYTSSRTLVRAHKK